MRYIKARQNIPGGKRSDVVHMSGFEGPLKNRILEKDLIAEAGTMSRTRYYVDIMPDGYCEIPDTEHNRKLLRAQIVSSKEISTKKPGEPGYIPEEQREDIPPIFTLIDKVDITKPAGQGYEDVPLSTAGVPDGYVVIPQTEWEEVKKKLHIGDESPDSQMQAALNEQAAADNENPTLPASNEPSEVIETQAVSEPITESKPVEKKRGRPKKQKEKMDSVLSQAPDEE